MTVSISKSDASKSIVAIRKLLDRRRIDLFVLAEHLYNHYRLINRDSIADQEKIVEREIQDLFRYTVDDLRFMYNYCSDKNEWLSWATDRNRGGLGRLRIEAYKASPDVARARSADLAARRNKDREQSVSRSPAIPINPSSVAFDDGPAEPPATDDKGRILGANGTSSLAPNDRLLLVNTGPAPRLPETPEEEARRHWYSMSVAARSALFNLPEAHAHSDNDPDCGMIPRPNRVRQKPEKAPPPKLAKSRRRKAS